MSTAEQSHVTIIEPAEEIKPTNEGDDASQQKQHGNFSRAFGNMMRRSKRLM